MGTLEKSLIKIAIVWLAFIICCFVMKKIQPEIFWLYFFYGLFVCVLLTAFVLCLLKSASIL